MPEYTQTRPVPQHPLLVSPPSRRRILHCGRELHGHVCRARTHNQSRGTGFLWSTIAVSNQRGARGTPPLCCRFVENDGTHNTSHNSQYAILVFPAARFSRGSRSPPLLSQPTVVFHVKTTTLYGFRNIGNLILSSVRQPELQPIYFLVAFDSLNHNHRLWLGIVRLSLSYFDGPEAVMVSIAHHARAVKRMQPRAMAHGHTKYELTWQVAMIVLVGMRTRCKQIA